MKQLIIALLMKLSEKYPDKKEIFEEVMAGFDSNYESNREWVSRTNLTRNSAAELFDKLPLSLRVKVLLNLVRKLYPDATIKKKGDEDVYLIRVGDIRLFYDAENNKIIAPRKLEEPRVFHGGVFVSNLPKLKEFFSYLETYSLRKRRFLA